MITESENDIPILKTPELTLDSRLEVLKDIVLSRVAAHYAVSEYLILFVTYEDIYNKLHLEDTGFSYNDFSVVLAYLMQHKGVDYEPLWEGEYEDPDAKWIIAPKGYLK